VQIIARGERVEVSPVMGALVGGGQYDSRRDKGGEVVVYNVWAAWCGPCRAEAPELARSALSLKKLNVRFVGINVRDNDSAAAAFERRYRIPYPSIRSADAGQALLAFGRDLLPNAIPTTLLVDAESRLAARIIGPTTFSMLRDAVQAVR
jgi:thiol-disulfide isomerase/thioredoxin